MSIKSLDNLLNPQRICVIGADVDDTSIGSKKFKNLIDRGLKDSVYPDNPFFNGILGATDRYERDMFLKNGERGRNKNAADGDHEKQ